MIRVTVTPRATADIYGLPIKKELRLRSKNSGTLHRKGAKKRGEDKWTRSSYPGWIRFRQRLSAARLLLSSPDHQRMNGSFFHRSLASLIVILD
jgi:hypothetical protein